MKTFSLLESVLIVALSACSSEPAQPTLDPTQGAQFLAGQYTTTINADDVSKFFS